MPRFSPDLITSCHLHFLSESQEAPARIAPPASQLKAGTGLVPLLSVSPSPHFPGPCCSCSHSCVSPGSGEPYPQLPRDWHRLPPLALPCFSHSSLMAGNTPGILWLRPFALHPMPAWLPTSSSVFKGHLPKAAFPAHSLYNGFPTSTPGLCVLFVP